MLANSKIYILDCVYRFAQYLEPQTYSYLSMETDGYACSLSRPTLRQCCKREQLDAFDTWVNETFVPARDHPDFSRFCRQPLRLKVNYILLCNNLARVIPLNV